MHLFLGRRGRCSLVLQLAPIFDQLWGTTAPKQLGVPEKRKWGSIDLYEPFYEVFWPAQAPKFADFRGVRIPISAVFRLC